MSPRRTSWVRVIAASAVAALLAFDLAPVATNGGAAAAAEAAYPTLLSFEVHGRDALPDQPVTISYETSGDVTLSAVVFRFTRLGRTYHALAGPAPAATGQVHLTLPDGARNGVWQLDAVTLQTTEARQTSYLRLGSVRHIPSTPAEQHTLDLPASDVTLSGSTEDLDPPRLTSVSTSPGTYGPGQPVTVDYALEDRTAPESVLVILREQRTLRELYAYRALGTSQVPSSDSITLTIPDGAANGTYVIDSVVVRDVMGNGARYRADGTVVDLTGAELGRHDLGLDRPCFVIAGSSADDDAPVLTAFSVAERAVAPGRPLTVHYAVTEQQGRLTFLRAVWVADGAVVVAEVAAYDLPLTGTVSVPTTTEGPARLESVEVGDGRQSAVYHRDGTVRTGNRPLTRHGLDFAARDVVVGGVPGAPVATALPGRGSVTVRWQPPAAHGSPVSGYTVTASPAGGTRTVSATTRSTTFTGLADGRAHTFTVRASNAFGSGAGGKVAATPRSFVRIASIGDWDGDWNNDLAAVDASGNLWAYRGDGRGGFRSGRARIGTGWQETRVLTPTNGPVNFLLGNFSPDLTAVRYDAGMTKYIGTNRGRWQMKVPMPGSWSAYSRVMGVGEWTEDGMTDLMTVDDAGRLRLHRASSFYAYGTGTVIGTGWGSMRQVFAAGDFSGDLHGDLMAVSPGGVLYLYKGTGRGGWRGSRVAIGRGWQVYRTVLSPGDFTGDDKADLIAVKANGDMFLYRGNGKGGFSGGGTRIGKGWGIYQ